MADPAQPPETPADEKQETEKPADAVPSEVMAALETGPMAAAAAVGTAPADPTKLETRPHDKVDAAEAADDDDDGGKKKKKPKKAEEPLVTAESPRARTQTVVTGKRPDQAPPEIPTTAPPMPTAMGGTEDPTNMPGAKDIPGGHPNDPAAAPGTVPPGDSRSLRRGGLEFALVYRQETFVITRTGAIGTRGQWRVVEYPTSASASHSYAKECSRFVAEGFSDYRA